MDIDIYDSDVVLTFQDILEGRAGKREAQAARDWADGLIRAPAATVYNFTVESEAGHDMRVGNRKRRRTDAEPVQPASAAVVDKSKPKPLDSLVDQLATLPAETAFEPIKPLLSHGDEGTMLPPPSKPSTARPAAFQGVYTDALPEGSNARLKAWQPVPDCFQVLTKVDISGKIRKTFVTPDGKRWYALKDAKAHWDALGGDMTCTTHPAEKLTAMNPTITRSTPPPMQSPPPPFGQPEPVRQLSADVKRGGVLVIPDQFRVTSKVDAGGKERKSYYTPDERKFSTFKDAKAYWEGLGHTLTYDSIPAPPAVPTHPPQPPLASTPGFTPPAYASDTPGTTPPFLNPAAVPPPKHNRPLSIEYKRGAALLMPDQIRVSSKVDAGGKDRKTYWTPDNRRFSTFKEAKAYWEGLGNTFTYVNTPPPAVPSEATPSSSGGPSKLSRPPSIEFKRGTSLLMPDQFRVMSKVDAGGKDRKTYFTPDNRRFVTFKEAKAYWEGLGHTLTYNNTANSPAAPAGSTPASATPATSGHSDGGSRPPSTTLPMYAPEEPPPSPGGEGEEDGEERAEAVHSGGWGGGAGGGGSKRLQAGEKWVPAGWRAEKKVRTKGNRQGAVDWTYVAPDGTMYRSYVAAQAAFNQYAADEPELEAVEQVPAALRSLARLDTLQPIQGLADVVERARSIARQLE